MTSPGAAQQTSNQVIINLTMTEAKARAVPWQRGAGPSGPIGQLLDTKQITHRDLAWAVRAAYDPRVRQAAQTLLAYWIAQPETVEATRRYGPEVVLGSHYLADQELDHAGAVFFYGGFATGAGIFLVLIIVQSILSALIQGLAEGRLNPILILAIIFIVVVSGATAWWIYIQMRRHLSAFRAFRTGREGEEAALEKLRAALDNRWAIFRSLQLPGRKDDCDLILVGPGGVWLLEIKAYHGTVRAQGKRWERQTKGGWTVLDENPSQQVRRMAIRLNDFLQRQGIKRWVETAVVLAEPQPVSNFESSEVPVWLVAQLEERAVALSTRKPPTEAEIAQVVNMLKAAAAKSLEKETTV
jgi:hypothetical protein